MNTNGIDLTGRVYGRLTVLSIAGHDKKGQLKWLCRCSCGNEKIVLGMNLRNLTRGTKSCGCILKGAPRRKVVDRIGKTYGKLTVIAYAGRNEKGDYLWLCRCECGKEVVMKSVKLNKYFDSCNYGCGNISHKRGENAAKWKGGRNKKTSGYIELKMWDHPNANGSGYVLEHVYVMSQIIGRPLIKGETIHHKNGVRDDNAPDNLELRASNHGPGQRIIDLVPYWKKMLELYEPVMLKLLL